ncbi:hypothetical protein BU16DRAFT_565901 [Lophium mytilinum]|uniref:Protein disulfide-isomerase n=1 Tax=Lophium mytilinum TaxID=390894 RepID=A0A6A6QEZ7_9PEZI|nr:hypothetical protein BU16DRAFT_565901 [Lophium mytilinum]
MIFIIGILWFSISVLCSTVENLSSNDFQRMIRENEVVLAAFTSKTVKLTDSFHNEFEQAARVLTSPLVMIDCAQEFNLCREYDVNAYPAVRLFRGSNESNTYRGPRKAPAIVSYMIKEQLPSVTHVDEDSIAEFREIDGVVIVAYLDPEDAELIDTFSTYAREHHDDFVFGIATEAQLAKVDGLPVPSVTVFKIREGDNTALNGRFDQDSLGKFLAMATPSVIGEITKRNIDTYMSAGKPIAYIFVNSEDDKVDLRRELTPVAKKYGQYMAFGLIDAAEYSHMATNMDLRPGIFPAFVIHDVRTNDVFPFDQRKMITAAAIEGLIMDMAQGKIKAGPVADDRPFEEGLFEVDEDGLDETNLAQKHDEL